MQRCTLFLFLCCLALGSVASNDLSVQQAHELASKGEVVLVDVRSLQEWQQTGIAENALPLSIHQQGGIPSFTQQLLKVLNGDKTKPIAIICAGGVRSSKVQNYLQQHGFTHVSNVKEGMIGSWFTTGWIEQGLPIKSYKNQ